jgi:hypothetical protein
MKTIDLSQFYGTEKYHKTSAFGLAFGQHLKHTDGVQYFAEQAGAFWFLDIVATEIYPFSDKYPFMTIYLTVKDGQAEIIVQDGDISRLWQRHIDFTDCPDGTYEFFLTDDVLMLCSEY